ncbi:MAG: hypothetical protein HY049_16115 [Acidobacteria bacterium]|nr:hypothetical protein [Acidobacteriota bacterium]
MKRVRPILSVVICTLAISAALVTVPSPASSSGDSRSALATGRSLDNLFVQIDARASGFGGLFLDENGEANVYLGESASRETTLAAVGDVLRAKGIEAGTIHVLEARYDFSTLARFKAALGPVQNLPGVVFTDIDEATNRIRIGIERGADRSAVEEVIAAAGVPEEAVMVDAAEPIGFLSTVTSRFRPLVGGVQIGFRCHGAKCYTCTDGFLADWNGVAGFVTCSHCTLFRGEKDGLMYSQPSPNSTSRRIVGAELVDPNHFTGGACPAGRQCRLSDSAFIATRAGLKLRRGLIARPEDVGSLTVSRDLPRFRITSVGSGTLVGEVLAKVGRTTGWTEGVVTNTCVDINITGTLVTLLCQDVFTAGAAPGDSGSPVFRIVNGEDVQLYGILWGGNASKGYSLFSSMVELQQPGELGPIFACDPIEGC